MWLTMNVRGWNGFEAGFDSEGSVGATAIGSTVSIGAATGAAEVVGGAAAATAAAGISAAAGATDSSMGAVTCAVAGLRLAGIADFSDTVVIVVPSLGFG